MIANVTSRWHCFFDRLALVATNVSFQRWARYLLAIWRIIRKIFLFKY